MYGTCIMAIYKVAIKGGEGKLSQMGGTLVYLAIHFVWKERFLKVRIYINSWEVSNILPVYQETRRRKNGSLETRMCSVGECGWTNGSGHIQNVL